MVPRKQLAERYSRLTKSRPFHVDRRGKDHILAHTDPKHNMPEDTPTDA